MIELGQLELHAGRLKACRVAEDSLEVRFRERGSKVESKLHVARVVNCTGPDYDVNQSSDPLIKQLRKRGYIRPDSLGLGLDVTNDGALISATGSISKTLFTIGPWLKGRRWETTAVPEIRTQASLLAQLLVGQTQKRTRLIA